MMGRNSYFCQLVRSLSIASIALTISIQSAFATDPDVSRILPYGGQVGQQVEVTFSGNRLEDAVEIVAFKSGLEITEVTAPEDKKGREVKAKIKVLDDCDLGPHRLRVRTKSGLSEVVTFFVGTLPVVEEKEPNTEFTAPQAIENKVTVHGRIDNEDVDYFTVTANKGERLSVEVEGLRLGTEFAGSNFFDPYIAILNESRFELAACDDHALTYQDGFASLIVPEDGTYYIEIRDASYGG
ncbi:MAG TPA: peptidase, partial [Planctomycetaceae bacterium]|nr:peptidase [Planctomycetaceae bacterium]